MRFMKAAALVLPLFATSLYAAPKKEAFHCVDASGKEVAGIKGKHECKAPNKWAKAEDSKTSAAAPIGTTTPAK